VGVEEEVLLLDPRDWSAANEVRSALATLPARFTARASHETHACVIELKTDVHPTVGEALAELDGVRRVVAASVGGALGLRLAASGTHPWATAAGVATSTSRRYREVAASMRVLARREPTMAQHVHVGVPDADTAVRALDGLRAELPVLLALSANSPFWCGDDSGFASMRTPVFGMFPRTGPPPHFGSYRRYVAALEPLLRARAILDPGFVWWDARLRPRLGTIEVRVLDAQSRIVDTAALAALVQCVVLLHAEGRREPAAPAPVLEENRFLAARDGMRARFLDARAPRGRRAARDALERLLDACEPLADRLDCAAELGGVPTLAADPGDVRQRRHAAAEGLDGLLARLSAEFAPAGGAVSPVGWAPTGTSGSRSPVC
jgi:carboxylate-amine ligase